MTRTAYKNLGEDMAGDWGTGVENSGSAGLLVKGVLDPSPYSSRQCIINSGGLVPLGSASLQDAKSEFRILMAGFIQPRWQLSSLS